MLRLIGYYQKNRTMKVNHLNWKTLPFLLIFSLFFSACGSRFHRSITDIEGNEYPTLIIGGQEWMIENLRTGTYNDGTAINFFDSNEGWINSNTGAYVWYDHNQDNKETHGALYNWHAVDYGRLCPANWRVPDKRDWDQLIEFMGGEEPAVAQLKAGRSSNLPGISGGYSFSKGQFNASGNFGYWWSAEKTAPMYGWYGIIYGDFGKVYRYYVDKRDGYSVRCLRNI